MMLLIHIGVETRCLWSISSNNTFRFYNILILAFIVITAVTLKEFGPMRKAEIEQEKEIKLNQMKM